MPITVECGACGKAYRVADDKAGKRMKCKECDTVVPIPESDFLADDADVEELDDDFDFKASRRSASGRASSARGGKTKQKQKQKQKSTGWKSPKVQYAGAAGVLVVAVGVVLLILQRQGYFGGGTANAEADDPTSKPISGRLSQGVEISLRGEPPVWCDSPGRFHMLYKLKIVKNGGSPILSREGWVEKDDRPRGLEADGPDRLKVKPRPMDAAAITSETAALNTARANLGKMSIAIHKYHRKNSAFPTSYMQKKGLSWRVHLLPELGHKELYDQFKLDEPWDSPHNKALISKMPDVFKTAAATRPGTTTLHIFVGPGTPFGQPKPAAASVTYRCRVDYVVRPKVVDPEANYEFQLEVYRPGTVSPKRFAGSKKFSGRDLKSQPKLELKIDVPVGADEYRPTRFRDLTDGVPNVIQNVVAGPETAVEWTKPGGLPFDRSNPFPALGTVPASGFPAVMFNGRVVTVPIYVAPSTLSRVVQHRDGHVTPTFPPNPPLEPSPDPPPPSE